MPLTRTAPFPPCPSCGSDALPVPILYGYPTEEAWRASERGELDLGGCQFGDESPDYRCRACERPLPWVTREDENP